MHLGQLRTGDLEARNAGFGLQTLSSFPVEPSDGSRTSMSSYGSLGSPMAHMEGTRLSFDTKEARRRGQQIIENPPVAQLTPPSTPEQYSSKESASFHPQTPTSSGTADLPPMVDVEKPERHARALELPPKFEPVVEPVWVPQGAYEAPAVEYSQTGTAEHPPLVERPPLVDLEGAVPRGRAASELSRPSGTADPEPAADPERAESRASAALESPPPGGTVDSHPVVDPERAEQRAREATRFAAEKVAQVQHRAREATDSTSQAAQQAMDSSRQAAEAVQSTALETAQAQRHKVERTIQEAAQRGEEVTQAVQERSAQAAEAAREKAGGVMGAVRDATLNTAQQTREMFDALQQKTLDTVVTSYPRKGQDGGDRNAVATAQDAAGDIASAIASFANQLYQYLHEGLEAAVGAASLTTEKLESLAEMAVGVAAFAVLQTAETAKQAGKVGLGATVMGVEKAEQVGLAAADAVKHAPEKAQELAQFGEEAVADVARLIRDKMEQVAPETTGKVKRTGLEAKALVEEVQQIIKQKAQKYGLTDEEAAQQLVMNVVKSAPSFTLEVVVEAGNLLADKAEQIAPRPVHAARRRVRDLQQVPHYLRELIIEVLTLLEDKGNQIAPGLTHRIRVLLESLDELWALTWDKLDQWAAASRDFARTLPRRMQSANQDVAALLQEILALLRDKAVQAGSWVAFAVNHPTAAAGMVAHGCQELAVSAVQAAATGAVFMYGALVASTVQTAHVMRYGARLYVFYVAAGTEWVWATTYATAESALAALRTATLMGTALAFFAVDLGKTITVAATDKALALLRGEAALAHRAAMVGVQLVKQARQEVKPAAETVVAAGLLTYGAVGAAALSTPKIAYKTIEVGVQLSLVGPYLGWWAVKKVVATEFSVTKYVVLTGAQVAGSLYGAVLEYSKGAPPPPISTISPHVASSTEVLDDNFNKQTSQVGSTQDVKGSVT